MYNSNNIFGIQKTEEVTPRSNLDMVLGASGAASQGAQLGSNFGPWGAGIGAGVGFAAGLAGQQASKNIERRQYDAAKSYNRFVYNLEGRLPQNENMVPTQARNGYVSSSQEIAEIEGNEKTGYGEIHVDKNYNIKNVANGQPSHENGGMKVVMDKSDIVFDTQKNPNKYKQVMENIKRYKLSGDKRAKEWLDKEAASKPSDSDYGYTNKYFGGFNGKKNPIKKANVTILDPNNLVTPKDYNKLEQTTGGNGPIQGMETQKIVNPIQESITPTKEVAKTTAEQELEVPTIEENQNQLKYANVLNNIVQGTKTAEKTTRRYFTPEKLNAVDRSYAIRNAIIEERNAERESLRGKGLSTGQQQGYMGQIGSRYLGKMEEVNEREAQKADEIQKYNAANRMQAAQSNLGLANQYDTQDTQNRAMRQNYINAASQETAQIGDISEQRRYMIDRDNKDYQMEKIRYKFTGTENMKPELDSNGQPTGRYTFRKSDGKQVVLDKNGKIVG